VPYGDADLVVHLLVQARGRVSAFARGARKSARRFAGALEPFSVIEAMVTERRSAELWSLHEATLLEGYPGLRADLSRLAHAGYAAELIHELTRAGEAADAHFALLADFLERLSRGAATSSRLRALELGALAAAGLAPELNSCARCGGELPPKGAALDPSAGGLCCARCAGPGALPLTSGARLLLHQLQAGGLAAADAPLSADGSGRPADPRGFEQAALQASPALSAFLGHHLGRTLRSASFHVEVGAPR
jgi:DNA repair protein RecO (recombination protein O)